MTNPDSSPKAAGGAGRGAGRPRAFETDAVIETAMQVFWRDGYAGASVPDISAATGLSPSSLYNAFGSKIELYEAALDRYLDRVMDRMAGPLARGTEGLADVEAFLDRLAATSDRTSPRGCLAVNTIGEFRDAPPAIAARTARYREIVRDGLDAALIRAAERGEIPADGVAARRDTLLPIVIAFNLLVAAGAPPAETRALLDAGRRLAASA